MEKVKHFVKSTGLIFLWRSFTIVSRIWVLSLTLAAVAYGFSHSILTFIITAICTIVLIFAPGLLFYTRTNTDHVLQALMYIFINSVDFVSQCDGPIRKRATLYYSVIFILNIMTEITWYMVTPISDFEIKYLVGSTLIFFLGIMSMLTHYLCAHTNSANIRKWISCNKLHLNLGNVKRRLKVIFLLSFIILSTAVILREVQ